MQAFTQLEAVAVPLDRANVDTDQIVPALYLQKPRIAPFGDFLFHDVRRDAQGALKPGFTPNMPAYAGARILVAGPNFGCGSSREHAVWALFDGGIRAVIAPSFGDIFSSNALKNGLLPVRLPVDVVTHLMSTLLARPGTTLRIDLQTQTVSGPDGLVAGFTTPPFARHCMLEGMDLIDYTLAQSAAIAAFERARQAA